MKAYYVMRLDETNQVQLHLPYRDVRGNRILSEAPYWPKADQLDPTNIDGAYFIYGVDTQEQADELAKFLTQIKPGTTWLVCEAKSVFRCQPGPVKRSVFTPGGLLPVNDE